LESDFPSWLPYVVSKGLVFGRMLPEQKMKLVEYFQNMGYVTAMCGDGANDAGVLLHVLSNKYINNFNINHCLYFIGIKSCSRWYITFAS